MILHYQIILLHVLLCLLLVLLEHLLKCLIFYRLCQILRSSHPLVVAPWKIWLISLTVIIYVWIRVILMLEIGYITCLLQTWLSKEVPHLAIGTCMISGTIITNNISWMELTLSLPSCLDRFVFCTAKLVIIRSRSRTLAAFLGIDLSKGHW